MLTRVVAFIAALAGLSSASVSDCSSGSSLFKLTSMSFAPDPPIPGQNSTLLLSMDVPEEINDGTATYSITMNYIPFQPTVDPLCDTTVPCPITVGPLNTVSSYPFPDTLSGALTMKIQWADGAGRQLLCVQIKTNLLYGNETCPVNYTGFAGFELVPYIGPKFKQIVVAKKAYLRGSL